MGEALKGRVAVVTGGTGVLGTRMTRTLAAEGAVVVALGRDAERGERVADQIRDEGLEVEFAACDVLDAERLDEVRDDVVRRHGRIDVLVNAAGGNAPEGTTSEGRSFFELDLDAIDRVMRLNFTGTLAACRAFGNDMTARGEGTIVNIASMASYHPMTRVVAYGAAKAAIVNFTEWLAVHFAQEYGPGLRVNALAPGFFLTEQNRYLLTDRDTGGRTPRGDAILRRTPLARYGEPHDLDSALRFLVDPASAFVTGIVVPVDGGFLAYSGV